MNPGKFSQRSLKHLQTCHIDLQRLFTEVVKYYDCAVICGHRGEYEQTEAYETGKSKLKFPQSLHNKLPSLAIDVVPCPINWNNKEQFYHFIGFVMATATHMGIRLRSGADWDGDFDLKDQSFMDLPHFELVMK